MHRKQLLNDMHAELENKGIQLFAAKHKITYYMNEVQKIQENLYGVYKNMNNMVDTMPVRLDEYWAGAEDELQEEDTKMQKEESTSEKFVKKDRTDEEILRKETEERTRNELRRNQKPVLFEKVYREIC